MISQRGSNDLHQKNETFELCTSNCGQVTWIVEYAWHVLHYRWAAHTLQLMSHLGLWH